MQVNHRDMLCSSPLIFPELASSCSPYLDTRTPYLSARHGRGSCSSWSAKDTTQRGSIGALPPASGRASNEKRGVCVCVCVCEFAVGRCDGTDAVPAAAAAASAVGYWKAVGALRKKGCHKQTGAHAHAEKRARDESKSTHSPEDTEEACVRESLAPGDIAEWVKPGGGQRHRHGCG
jgi:hypothetical protein